MNENKDIRDLFYNLYQFILASALYMEMPFEIDLTTVSSRASARRTDDRLGVYTVIMDAMKRWR